MAAAFGLLAERQRLSAAELLRQVVNAVLAGQGAPAPDPGDATAELDATLQTYVLPDVKQAWKNRARRVEMTQSDMLRAAVAAVLKANPVTPEELTAVSKESAAAPEDALVRVQVPFKAHELEAVDARATQLGWRRSTWIASVVRNAAFNEPRPTDAELAAVMRGTAEVLAVGRNLNQIARAMHRDDRYKDSVTLERVDQVRAAIEAHIRSTQALLEAIENRWKPGEGFRPETE